VIEITDGDDDKISVLSQAICNGKKSWIQTRSIPLTIQEDAKKSGDTTKQTDRYSCHFQTMDAATTGLHHSHIHNAYHQKQICISVTSHVAYNGISTYKQT
jgi:hypothetical protein